MLILSRSEQDRLGKERYNIRQKAVRLVNLWYAKEIREGKITAGRLLKELEGTERIIKGTDQLLQARRNLIIGEKKLGRKQLVKDVNIIGKGEKG